ncbi:MAG: hypothetical protein ACP5DQ_11950 [Bacteroidales bacterium]
MSLEIFSANGLFFCKLKFINQGMPLAFFGYSYRNVIRRKMTIPEESNILVSRQECMWGQKQSHGNRKLVNGKQNQGVIMNAIFLSYNSEIQINNRLFFV